MHVVSSLSPAVLPTPEEVADAALSFREMYDKYFDFVYRCARRLGVNERALDDAVQDVFIVAYRRRDSFEGRSTMKTWLYGITRRVAKDHRRRVARKEQGMVPTDGLASIEPSPQESSARNEALAMVQEILATFDESKREVFVLAEMEQMTVPEIAETLSVNLNTVYSRLRKARQEFERAVQSHHRKGEL